MLKCKEFVYRISSEKEQKTHWLQKPNLLLHYIICVHCRNYTKQLTILNKNIKAYFSKNTSDLDKENIKQIENEVLKKIISK